MSEPRGFVLWLMGLSGCGKSTLGILLHEELVERGLTVCYCDEAAGPPPTNFAPDLIYICAYRELPQQTPQPKVVIVYLQAHERILRQRDIHGWYQAAASGDEAAQAAVDVRSHRLPEQPDMLLRTDMQEPLESAGRILGALEDSGLIPLAEL